MVKFLSFWQILNPFHGFVTIPDIDESRQYVTLVRIWHEHYDRAIPIINDACEGNYELPEYDVTNMLSDWKSIWILPEYVDILTVALMHYQVLFEVISNE